ncbi:unnamed protein product [Ceratitis capitata]|uniref:(Mediterranean fruit fly) hypothetical protein n=1 Tax=Ceratitis capitata TaxID=7213 RepID=A0A811V0R8_CERCA|nr:unnamed protein product [Ceratitis capitata]
MSVEANACRNSQLIKLQRFSGKETIFDLLEVALFTRTRKIFYAFNSTFPDFSGLYFKHKHHVMPTLKLNELPLHTRAHENCQCRLSDSRLVAPASQLCGGLIVQRMVESNATLIPCSIKHIYIV